MISGTAEVYDIGVIGVKTAQLFFGAFRIRIRNLSVSSVTTIQRMIARYD